MVNITQQPPVNKSYHSTGCKYSIICREAQYTCTKGGSEMLKKLRAIIVGGLALCCLYLFALYLRTDGGELIKKHRLPCR